MVLSPPLSYLELSYLDMCTLSTQLRFGVNPACLSLTISSFSLIVSTLPSILLQNVVSYGAYKNSSDILHFLGSDSVSFLQKVHN